MSTPQKPLNLTGRGMIFQEVENVPENINDTSGNDPFHLSDLNKEDNHFKEIAIDFQSAGLNIVRVQRLQNLMKWKSYKSQKDICLEGRKKVDANYCLNERYLYHGTAAEIKDVCEFGLDDKLSGDGCFGKGIYFSDNPRKCTKYANRRKGDEGLILCARVILGDIKVYPDGKQDRALLREPEKKGKFKGFRFYDSVQGRPKDFKEFVVYRAQNTLIEYLITYSKSSTSKTNHSEGNIPCPNRPKVSTEQNFHHPISTLNTSYFSHKSSISKMPILLKEQGFLDHSITTPSIQTSTPVPSEDTSSDESDGENNDENDDFCPYEDKSSSSEKEIQRNAKEDTSSDESDGENNDEKDDFYHYEDKSSSDEEKEIQRKAKEVSDSERTGRGSDTNSDEDLSSKEKDKIKSCYSGRNVKKEEIILAQKRRQFTEHTGEFSEYLVETFLLASDFDVRRAIEMYRQKKKRDAQKMSKPAAETEEHEQKKDVASGDKSEPDFVQGKTVPEFNSPEWNQMSEKDKEEVVNILVENFLAITTLSEAKAPLARNVLKMAHYNLDQAIVSYYESI